LQHKKNFGFAVLASRGAKKLGQERKAAVIIGIAAFFQTSDYKKLAVLLALTIG
jgi:hypothetical protein